MVSRVLELLVKCSAQDNVGLRLTGPLQSCVLFPFFCTTRPLSAEAMAAEILEPGESLVAADLHAEEAQKSQQEYSLRVEGCLVLQNGLEKLSSNTSRRLLEEQRKSLHELGAQLKEQGMLLRSIWEQVSFLKSDCSAKRLVVNSRSSFSKPSAEIVGDVVSEPHEEKSKQGSTTCKRDFENSDASLEKSVNIGTILMKKESDINKFQHPSWPEWAVFLDHLKPFAVIKQGTQSEAAGSGDIFECTSVLKHALVKFAQAHEVAFRRLSRKDLCMLVECESIMDEKTAAAKKRLQDYLRTDENNISPSISQAKLTDVVRLMYRALRSTPLSGTLPSELALAIVHILQVLNSSDIIKPNVITSESVRKMNGKPMHLEEIDSNTSVAQGSNQKIKFSKVDDAQTLGRKVDTVPITCPRSSHDKSSSCTSDVDYVTTTDTATGVPSVEQPKFSSIKERVDARRTRLARESLEKEAAKSMQPPPSIPKPGSSKNIQMDDTKKGGGAAKNFEAFDAIIESEDSDDNNASKTQRDRLSRAFSSTSVKNTLSLPKKNERERVRRKWK